jgi:NAD(P)-dependent dehydrogenase (short-subunit alcohol dehydrogenase family)
MTGHLTLTDKVALVTGGGSGIGQEVCRRLTADGATVVVVDSDQAAAAITAAAIGAKSLAVAADVSRDGEMDRAISAAVERFGRLDIAVNAAGVGFSAALVDTTLEQWERVLNVCLTGVFLSTRAEARQMVKQGHGGVIINIASTNSQQPGEGLSAYCSAKAGVDMLTKVSALELASHGIRVTAVAPGLTETPMVARFLSNPQIRNEFLSNIPLGRPALTADIAAAVAFLASDDAGYITGQTLYVDGGASMQKYPSLASRKPSAPVTP